MLHSSRFGDKVNPKYFDLNENGEFIFEFLAIPSVVTILSPALFSFFSPSSGTARVNKAHRGLIERFVYLYVINMSYDPLQSIFFKAFR